MVVVAAAACFWANQNGQFFYYKTFGRAAFSPTEKPFPQKLTVVAKHFQQFRYFKI